MNILAIQIDDRIQNIIVTDDILTVDLMDGRAISVPLLWFPKLHTATKDQRGKWEICGGGYGIHWPDLDEDLSVEGLLRGVPGLWVEK